MVAKTVGAGDAPSAEAESDVVGRVVQPLAGVLADMAVAPVNHDAQHVAL